MTSDDGTTVIANLAEGTEVDIVAWRPRAAGGTRYRVRSGTDLEGWVGSASLAPLPRPTPPPAPAAPAATARTLPAGRRVPPAAPAKRPRRPAR